MEKKSKYIIRTLIFVYLVIPYLPLFGEIDRIASQWFFLSLINFISLGYIFFKKKLDSIKDFVFETKSFLFFGLFVLAAFLSVFGALNSTESLVEIFRHFSIMLLIFNLSSLISYNQEYKYVILLLFIFSFLDIVGLLLQNYQGLPMIGFTGNKNIASASLIIKIALTLSLLYYFKNLYFKIFFFLFLTISFIVVVLIGSKAGILSIILLLSILVISLIYRYSIFQKNFLPILSIIISFILISISNNNLSEAVKDTINYKNDKGSTDRLRYYEQSIQAFIENPINGIGIGNWKIYSLKYDSLYMKNYVVQYHTHNDYLQIFAETGIFGGLMYVAFIISLFYIIIKLFFFKKLSKKNKIIIFFCFGAMTIYFIDSNLNFPMARVVMQLNLSVIIAILYSLKINQKNVSI